MNFIKIYKLFFIFIIYNLNHKKNLFNIYKFKINFNGD